MTAEVAAPRVSVVIPSHDTARYAARAVDSALAQTVKDLEVVLVDDGSGARDAAALDAVASRERVRLVRIPHSGPGRARRAGWEAARGEYVAFLDDDDRQLPRYAERCLERFAERPAFGAVYTAFELVDGAGRPKRRLPARGPSGRIFADEVRKTAVKTSTLTVRRRALLALSGLLEHFRTGENYDLILRLCYEHEFGFVDEALVVVEDRPGSTSKDHTRRHQNRAEVLEHLLRLHPDMDVAERRAVRRKAAKYYRKEARRELARRSLARAARLGWRSLLAGRRLPGPPQTPRRVA